MIDSMHVLLLALDTGLLVLIWLVQLVIYPGFTHYTAPQLKAWHTIYTRRVTLVVLPLMLGQLAISIYLIVSDFSYYQFIHLLCISIAWWVTFLRAVPLHGHIDRSTHIIKLAHQLVRINWWRTVVWTMAWGMSVFTVFFL